MLPGARRIRVPKLERALRNDRAHEVGRPLEDRLLAPLPRSLLLLQGCPLEVLGTTHVRGSSVKSLPLCVGCVIGARLSYSLHIRDGQGREAYLVRFCL